MAVSTVMDYLIDYLKENIVSKSKESIEGSIIDQYEKVCLGVDGMISTQVCFYDGFK